MGNEQRECPLCGEEARYDTTAHHIIHRWYGCACGAYYAHDIELSMADGEIKAGKYKRLPALLHERFLKGNREPLLVFQRSEVSHAKNNITFADAIFVGELLAHWPETVLERIDRCLCNLANYKQGAGEAIELPNGINEKKRDVFLFADNREEAAYYINALTEYDWLLHGGSHQKVWRLVITPEGWERIGELTGGAERHRNSAFVAMWFGGDKQRGKMRKLFNEAIQPAIRDAGYLAERVDTVEHNEAIMGKVLEDIRKAPFVVAELTNNNPGVYFEAGFAKGRGVEVIYCVSNNKKEKPHFDVSGINHVRWDNLEDLRERLRNRILGTVGHGPHEFDE